MAANRPTRLGTVMQQAHSWTAKGITFQDPHGTSSGNSTAVIDQEFRPDVSTQALDKIVAAITNGGLWNVPAWRYSVETFDGETVVLELRAQGAYRLIIRGKVTDAPVDNAVRAVLAAAGVPEARD